jgi:hypothetical protein
MMNRLGIPTTFVQRLNNVFQTQLLGGVLIKKIVLIPVPLMILLIVLACGSIKSFENTIDSINKNEFIVNCSNEVNRGKKGSINSVGYLCNVGINSTTVFKDRFFTRGFDSNYLIEITRY